MTTTPVEQTQAEALVRAYCGWHVWPGRQETLQLDGPGGHALMLPSLHVVSIDQLTELGTDLVDGTDFTWSVSGFLHRIGQSWSWDYGYGGSWGWWTCQLRGITVQLTHGYDEMPPELGPIIEAAGQRISENPTGLEQQTVGPFTEKYGAMGSGSVAGVLSSGDLAILSGYRLPPRP